MRKKKQTPAEIAQKITAYLKKQQDTLAQFPVGPLANAAKLNMQKANKALQALKMKNEELRVGQPTQGMRHGGPVPEFNPGGNTAEAEPGQGGGEYDARTLLMFDLIGNYGFHPDYALGATSVAFKENNSGDPLNPEMSYENTSIKRIRSKFPTPTEGMSDAEINALKKDPEAFFNKMYDGRMGNGEGEGFKYRGRGIIQITGKDNYRKASQHLFGDDRLVDNPDLIGENPHIAAKAAAWYLMEQGSDLTKYGVDVTQPMTEEGRERFMKGTFAKIAGYGPSKVDNLFDYVNEQNYNDSMATVNQYFDENRGVATELSQEGMVPRIQEELQSVAMDYGAAPQVPEGAPASGVWPTLEGEAAQNVAFQDVPLAEAGSPAGVLEDGTVWAQNAYGDYNVYQAPKTGENPYDPSKPIDLGPQTNAVVIKADDWNKYTDGKFDAASISNAVNQSKANHTAIPYLPQIDIADGSRKYGSSMGMRAMSPIDVGERTGGFVRSQLYGNSTVDARDKGALDLVGKYYGGDEAFSGAAAQFETAVESLMRDQGFGERPAVETKRVRTGSGGLKDGNVSFKRVEIPTEESRKWDKAYEEATAKVAANPGTIQWKDSDGKTRVGVSGYTPFSDYVSYATGDAEYTSGLQSNISSANIIGDLISPAGLGIKAMKAPAMAQGWRRAAVSRGSQAAGKAPKTIIIGEDGSKAFQYADDVAAQGSRTAGQLPGGAGALPEVSSAGAGLPQLPAGSATRPVISGVPGMRLAPTAGTGQAPTFIPGASSPLTTRVAGPAGIVPTPARQIPFLSPQQTRTALGRFGPNQLRLNQTAPVNNLGSGNQVFYGLPGGQGRNALGQFTANRPGMLVPGNQMLGNAGGLIPGSGAAQTGLIPYGGLQRYAGLQRYTGAPPMNISAPGAQLAMRGERGLSLANPTLGRAASGFDDATVIGSRAMRNPDLIARPFREGLYLSNKFTPFGDRALAEEEVVETEPGKPESLGGGDQATGGGDANAVEQTEDAMGGAEGTGGEAGIGGAGTDQSVAGPQANPKIPKFSTPLSLVPMATSMAATRAMRKAIEDMEAPSRPATNVIPKFNYQSNIGQALQDSSDAARSVIQSAPTNATGMAAQQAALAQRFKQDARLRAQDNVMRQGAERQYDRLATQVRATNNAIRNQYQDDLTQFNNQRETLLGANQAQGMRNVGTYAQDYIQNVLSPQYIAQIQAMGRPYDAASMLPDAVKGLTATKED